jgi:DNA-binding NarL/FixJ family response regulator
MSGEGTIGEIRRILIVDDHPVVTECLSAFLGRAADLEVCCVADNADEALRRIELRAPDAAVVDLSLKGPSGLELIRRIRAGGHRFPILVLSAHEEPSWVERALAAGADGYASKDEPLPRIEQALRLVLGGECYLSRALCRHVIRRAWQLAADDSAARLTRRELEIFRHVGEGLDTRGIAEKLRLSVSTVETHQRNIRRKLGLGTGRELVRRAALWRDAHPAE